MLVPWHKNSIVAPTEAAKGHINMWWVLRDWMQVKKFDDIMYGNINVTYFLHRTEFFLEDFWRPIRRKCHPLRDGTKLLPILLYT